MKIKSINFSKNKLKDFTVRDDIFAIEPRPDIIERVIKWQLSKRRSGNHKVKSRSEIKTTNAKMYRQKGTGRARHGNASVVQFRGGGVVHGPVVRDHTHKLTKKIRLLGLKSALSLKAKSGEIGILENEKLDKKTKTFNNYLKRSSFDKLLVVVGAGDNKNELYTVLKNIPNVDLISQIGLNVFDVLKKDKVLFTEIAVKEFEGRLLWILE